MRVDVYLTAAGHTPSRKKAQDLIDAGAVKIDGKVWSARMADDTETAKVGDLVTVVEISGVKLICKRK